MLKKPYSDQALEQLIQLAQRNNAKYEIYIDDMRIVARTTNYDAALDAVEYLNPTTKWLEFRIYKGDSHRFDKTYLMVDMNANPLKDSQNLSGTEAAKAEKTSLSLEEERKKWEDARLIEDLQAKVKEWETAYNELEEDHEDEIKELKEAHEKQLDALVHKHNSFSGMLEMVAPAAIQIAAKSRFGKDYPILGELAGFEPDDAPQPQQAPAAPAEPTVSFRSQEAPNQEPTLSTKDKRDLGVIHKLQELYTKPELDKIFFFAFKAYKNKEVLNRLADLVTPTPEDENLSI